MKLNLDEIVNAVLPEWHLPVVDGDKEYPTRAPNVGELAMLQSISYAKLAGEVGTSLIVGLFPHECPAVKYWDLQKRIAFVAGYMSVWARKNVLAVATKARIAVATAMTVEEAGDSVKKN
jgi:hypothetical protein